MTSSSSSEMMVKTVKKPKKYVRRPVKETKRPAESSDDEDTEVEPRPQRRTKMVFGRANPVPPLISSDEEDSGESHISSESSTTKISTKRRVNKRQQFLKISTFLQHGKPKSIYPEKRKASQQQSHL